MDECNNNVFVVIESKVCEVSQSEIKIIRSNIIFRLRLFKLYEKRLLKAFFKKYKRLLSLIILLMHLLILDGFNEFISNYIKKRRRRSG